MTAANAASDCKLLIRISGAALLFALSLCFSDGCDYALTGKFKFHHSQGSDEEDAEYLYMHQGGRGSAQVACQYPPIRALLIVKGHILPMPFTKCCPSVCNTSNVDPQSCRIFQTLLTECVVGSRAHRTKC